ncbi:MAG: PEP-CTERM sorting domain-containing protein [Luteolibacter sp.]
MNTQKACSILTALGLSSLSQAANVSFDNGGADSLWSTPENWSNDLVPTADDDITNFGANVEINDTQAAKSYDQRNNKLTISSGGFLTLTNRMGLTRGGAPNNNHELEITGTGKFSGSNINFDVGGSNDTVARISVSGTTSSLNLSGSISQNNADGTLVFTQSGGTTTINENFNVGTRGSATNKDYQVSISGTTNLNYGTANFGTNASANANTLVSLFDSSYEVSGTTTNLGVDGLTNFTFDSSGIGTWDAGDLGIDAGHQFVVDLTDADQSDSSATFKIFGFTTQSGFDASKFTFIGNDSATAFLTSDGIHVALVPEPSTFLLSGLTSLALLLRRRR